MRKTEGSRSISSQSPWRMASTKVTTPPRSGRFDLCSFLVAVDIQNLKSEILNSDDSIAPSLIAPEHFRAEGGRHAGVVEDVVGGLLRFGHRGGFGPGRVLLDLPPRVGCDLVQRTLRGDAV